MNSTQSRPLSANQIATVAAVIVLTTRLGYGPSVREIAALCGIPVPTAQHRLDGLRLRGALLMAPAVARSLRVGELAASDRALVDVAVDAFGRKNEVAA